jgi:hypothetical protein
VRQLPKTKAWQRCGDERAVRDGPVLRSHLGRLVCHGMRSVQ